MYVCMYVCMYVDGQTLKKLDVAQGVGGELFMYVDVCMYVYRCTNTQET